MATAKTAPRPAASKEVVKPEAKSTEVAAISYGEDTGAGYENQDSSHVSIPFIILLQAGSPQCKGEDAIGKSGQFFNTVTGDIYSGKTGFKFIPALVEHVYTEWLPREKGGGGGNGFRGVHQPDSDIVLAARKRPRVESQKKSVILTEDGNELVETFQMYGRMVDEDGEDAGLAIFGFTSTKIGVYKGYNTKLQMFNYRKAGFAGRPPTFANVVRFTSVEKTKGPDTFFIPVLTPAVDGDVKASILAPDDPLLALGREVYAMVKEGSARANYETAAAAEGGGGAAQDGEEIPF